MTTLQLPAGSHTTIPRRFRTRPAGGRHPLLWLSGVLTAAAVLFTVTLVAGKLLSQGAAALEFAPPEPDPFYQQKRDAVMQELPAQF